MGSYGMELKAARRVRDGEGGDGEEGEEGEFFTRDKLRDLVAELKGEVGLQDHCRSTLPHRQFKGEEISSSDTFSCGGDGFQRHNQVRYDKV